MLRQHYKNTYTFAHPCKIYVHKLIREHIYKYIKLFVNKRKCILSRDTVAPRLIQKEQSTHYVIIMRVYRRHWLSLRH